MSLNYANFIWSVADLLRGGFKAHQYGDIILPLTVLRRLDCVLAPTKEAVLQAAKTARAGGLPVSRGLLKARAGHGLSFWNTSRFDLAKLLGDPDNLAANLMSYVNSFSNHVKDIFANYKLEERVAQLEAADLLLLVVKRFAEVDLSPQKAPNEHMGHIFEELIRKFAEASNETAGEHFTPRDVIELMAELVLTPDDDALSGPHVVRSIYDPAAGTGGMLSIAEDHISKLNPTARLTLAGQEINPQSYAVCKADLIVKGQAFWSISNRAVNSSRLQAEAMANSEADFAFSPSIIEELEDIPYRADAGHQAAIKHLVTTGEYRQLAEALLAQGLYEALRRAAQGPSSPAGTTATPSRRR